LAHEKEYNEKWTDKLKDLPAKKTKYFTKDTAKESDKDKTKKEDEMWEFFTKVIKKEKPLETAEVDKELKQKNNE
jgi:hypothetical protein